MEELMHASVTLRRRSFGLSLCALLTATCFAPTLPADIVIGVFGNPVLAGNVANDPAAGQLTYIDNSSTAVYSINNSTSTTLVGNPPLQSTGSALTWGADSPETNQSYSVLTFFGAPIPADTTSPFKVGTVTFQNGTSLLNTLIFGAQLSFYDNSVAPENYLGTDQVIITTTNNLGQSVTQDADYINICGNQSNICGQSIEAIEETEGGTGVTADLYGTITGDPTLTLTGVQLEPGQSSDTNGFIGNDPPLAETPEPGSAGMLCLSLPLFAGLSVVMKRRATAAPR
jgi:hypothetical protein